MQRYQRDIAVLRVKQTADLAPARSHAFGETLARKPLRLHRLRNLPSQHFLDGDGLKRLARAFLIKELVEQGESLSATEPLCFHGPSFHLNSRIRLRASFKWHPAF